ncbi:MAG: SufS family cysteine desulfurase [Lachnospiraceae bacterium]|nr:SufS family cysteine desulfurase [Lachnospiraceae bacterium]
MSSANLRKDFPLLNTDKTIYLDNAATSQKPASVIEAEKEFYLYKNANPLRGFYPLSLEATKAYEDARKKVSEFINAKTDQEIVFTRNTTESMNLVAFSYGLSNIKPGDEIVVSVLEHHSNMLPWRMVAERTGAKIKYLFCEPDGTISDKAIEEAITNNTKLVAMGQISNVLGCLNPVEKVIKRVHEMGGVAVIDAAQSAPHMPVDVQALDADFLAFSGHKLLGPMGIGVLYVKEKILAKMPPFLTGGEMIESVTLEKVIYAKGPQKFEAGTVNAAGAAGLAAAIDYINGIGFDEIMEKEDALTKRAIEKLSAIPHVHILGSDDYKNHHGIVSFTIDDVHPHDVSEVLSSDGIAVRAGHHCAQPLLKHLGVNSCTRASFMFYNTEDEIDALAESVSKIREKMGYGK